MLLCSALVGCEIRLDPGGINKGQAAPDIASRELYGAVTVLKRGDQVITQLAGN